MLNSPLPKHNSYYTTASGYITNHTILLKCPGFELGRRREYVLREFATRNVLSIIIIIIIWYRYLFRFFRFKLVSSRGRQCWYYWYSIIIIYTLIWVFTGDVRYATRTYFLCRRNGIIIILQRFPVNKRLYYAFDFTSQYDRAPWQIMIFSFREYAVIRTYLHNIIFIRRNTYCITHGHRFHADWRLIAALLLK